MEMKTPLENRALTNRENTGKSVLLENREIDLKSRKHREKLGISKYFAIFLKPNGGIQSALKVQFDYKIIERRPTARYEKKIISRYTQ